MGPSAPTLKPSIPHLASTGDSLSDDFADFLVEDRAAIANAKAKRLPEEGAACSISKAHEVPTPEERVDSDSGSDETNSGYDSDGNSSEATVSSEADSSDGDGDSAVAESSGSKRPRSATTLPKKKTTAKKKKNQIAAADLNEDQIKTVEEELVLQQQSNWSLDDRAERAAAAIRSTRKELRKQRHGTPTKDATSRVAMQKASKILSSSQRLTVLTGLSGADWVKKWRKLQAVGIEDKLSNTTSGRGWLYSVLASKSRLKAIGGSMIGVERATRYGKDLRKLQQLDEVLAVLKKEDSHYFAWCVAPTPLPRPWRPQGAWRWPPQRRADGPRRWPTPCRCLLDRSTIDLERALTWDAVEQHAEEWGGGAVDSTLWKLLREAACFYGERLYLAFLVGGCPTRKQNDLHGWCVGQSNRPEGFAACS